MRGLVWFRQDLRIQDNPALSAAINECEQVTAVFVICHKTWQYHDHAPLKIKFWLDNLHHLSHALANLGIPLEIITTEYFTDCPDALLALCEQQHISAVYYNQQYEFDERGRDQLVTRKLGSQHITVNAFHDQVIAPPGAIMTQQQQSFKVFTPFKRRWLEWVNAHETWQLPGIKPIAAAIKAKPIPTEIAGFTLPQHTGAWIAGESAAANRLHQFCQASLFDYHHHRDFPALDGTSQLSPYLTAGVLSPRQCIHAILQTLGDLSLAAIYLHEGAFTWLNELIWREFYKHILYHYPRLSQHQPFQSQTAALVWNNDPDKALAWQTGRTGFPIVDAAMRQMHEMGWMHNRLRMITAMFYSKILWLDWREGERYFMQHLIDGDLSANNGGWQWCASTGTDAAPYFRIFNFTTQSERFDPEGKFIRQYLPELAHLDNDTIHDPYGRGAKLVESIYPKPIVDYKTQRALTIAAFKQLR